MGLDRVLRWLPAAWGQAVERLPTEIRQSVQEMRIRVRAPLTLSGPTGEIPLYDRSGRLMLCSPSDMEEMVYRLCDRSVYAHQQEMREGYISTCDGLRVGIAGTAVCQDGTVTAIRDVTSLCIRIPRMHDGCAQGLLRYLLADDRANGLLICAEPSGGKSSLLRDIARLLAERGKRVSVVDARGELSLGGCLKRCDVLYRYPPSVGLLQAVRVLAPEFVVTDELGDRRQTDALLQNVYGGVAVVASVHAADLQQLRARTEVWNAVCNGAFRYIAFLQGRQFPGQVRRIAAYEEWLREMDRLDNDICRRCGGGDDGGIATASTGISA